MVVEDEPDIYEILLTMFEMWGIDGVAFVDGEEAVAWIDDVDSGRFTGELPELVLIDIRLPGELDGDDVAERLRQSPILGNVAIVLTSANRYSEQEVEVMMNRCQADHWIEKPLPKFNDLQKKLEEVIARRRALNLLKTNAVPSRAQKPVAQKPATHKTVDPISKSGRGSKTL